jgi:hypothetical protein
MFVEYNYTMNEALTRKTDRVIDQKTEVNPTISELLEELIVTSLFSEAPDLPLEIQEKIKIIKEKWRVNISNDSFISFVNPQNPDEVMYITKEINSKIGSHFVKISFYNEAQTMLESFNVPRQY